MTQQWEFAHLPEEAPFNQAEFTCWKAFSQHYLILNNGQLWSYYPPRNHWNWILICHYGAPSHAKQTNPYLICTIQSNELCISLFALWGDSVLCGNAMWEKNSSDSMKKEVKLKANNREINIVLKANTSISALLLFQDLFQCCSTVAGSLTCAILPE